MARSLSQIHALSALATKGTAQSDLTFAGPWLPSINIETGAATPAQLQGWTRLQHAALKPAWLPEPIEIVSATAQFGPNNITPNSVTWANAAITLNGIPAKGSASYPATCDNPAGCPAEVTLDFPTLTAADLQSALLGAGHGEFLQAILSTVESAAPPWPALNGTIHAATLTIGNLKLTNARAAIAIRNNRLNLLSLDAATLGGSTHITGSIEPSSDGPQYALNITTAGIKLPEAAALFHEDWGTGALDGQMRLNLHGYSNLAASATGDFRFLLNGNWGGDWTASPPENNPSTQPPSQEPDQTADQPEPALLNASQSLSETPGQTAAHGPKSARQPQWAAAGTIASQTLTLTKGPVRGTIAFDRTLNLDWTTTHLPATSAAKTTAQSEAQSEAQSDPAQSENPSQISAENRPSSETPAPSPTRAEPIHITGTLAHPVAETPTNPPAPAKRPRNPRNN
jgi:hypothetical protein